MTFAETVLLGALAGFTIYLGLPLAQLGNLSNRTRVGRRCSPWASWRSSSSTWMAHGEGILEEAVEHWEEGESGFGKVALFGLVLGGGFAAGTAGIAMLERRMRPRGARPRRSQEARRPRPSRPRKPTRSPPRPTPRVAGRCPPGLPSQRPSASTTSPRAWPSGFGAGGRGQPRHDPDHRLRAPQRHRGLRHHWAAGGRPAVVEVAGPGGPDRRGAGVPRL